MIAIKREVMLTIGNPIIIEGRSPTATYRTVFEDDGETGYFCALARHLDAFAIVDALQIYVVASAVERHKPVTAKIAWSDEGCKSAFIVNNSICGLFDFSRRHGCCRANFPPPARNGRGQFGRTI